jgi:ABC-type nitrate/sulfonate/bicarbonate transport system substrate-binding protein
VTTPGSSEPIRMGVFYRSLPMMVAEERGFYEQNGMTIDYQRVTSSIQHFEFLRDGHYDMVHSSPDNVANYRLNAENPVGGRIDVTAFMGMDHGMNLVVTARPGITSVADLRGKTLAVDAPASGFAYVLYKILRAHGLERGKDYRVINVGGVADRYTKLLEGEFDATLLSGGFETRAASDGYELLDSVYDIASPYLGVVAAAKESWLEANRHSAVAMIRAYREATAWCLDPKNRDDCVDLLTTLPNTDRSMAEQLYEVQLRHGVGIVRDAGIDPDGLRSVVAMRAEFDGFEDDHDIDRLAREAGGIYTLDYFREATKG